MTMIDLEVEQIDREILDVMLCHYLTPLSSRCDATACSCGLVIPVPEGEKPGTPFARHLADMIAEHFKNKVRQHEKLSV